MLVPWHTHMDGDAGGRSSGNDDEDNQDDNYGNASRFLLKLLFPKFSRQHRGGVNWAKKNQPEALSIYRSFASLK